MTEPFTASAPIIQTEIQVRGPELWAELHRFAVELPAKGVVDWVAAWLAKIPFEGCPCERHWKIWVVEHPIRYSDLFAWSVEAHNEVNRRTGRDLVTVEEARALWSDVVVITQPPLVKVACAMRGFNAGTQGAR
tara:strand:- start:5698 stop:6099 length:402 start_codon:yes stop_codon:yes gene_type:complete